MRNIKPEEEIIIGADLNGHVGRDRRGFEQEHRGHSFGDRNEEGEDVLRFAQAYNLGLVNTFFQKQEEHLITYKSGNRRTTRLYPSQENGPESSKRLQGNTRREHSNAT